MQTSASILDRAGENPQCSDEELEQRDALDRCEEGVRVREGEGAKPGDESQFSAPHCFALADAPNEDHEWKSLGSNSSCESSKSMILLEERSEDWEHSPNDAAGFGESAGS